MHLIAETPLYTDKWFPIEDLEDLRPHLLVIVDTEEEFDWHAPFGRTNTSVTSMQAQYRIQNIFRRYGVRPTYVMDYPVASQPMGFEPLREWHDSGECLIGAHLHPWVNMPFEEEVNDVNSYPGNLPPDLERRKLEILTETITRNFSHRPSIYKAGRYGLGPHTFSTLTEMGYQIDLSPVPYNDMRPKHGPDFRNIRAAPYWIGKPGGLLTVPLSSGFFGPLGAYGAAINRYLELPVSRLLHLRGILSRAGLFEYSILTPEGVDTSEHIRLTRAMIAQGRRVFCLTYHSPSLAPGNTDYVRTGADLDRFLAGIERYLDFFLNRLNGIASDPISLRQHLLARISMTDDANGQTRQTQRPLPA